MVSRFPDTLTYTLSGHTGNVTAVRFNTNANYFCSVSTDKTLKQWNVIKGKLIYTFTGGHLAEILDATLFVSFIHNIYCYSMFSNAFYSLFSSDHANSLIATCGADKLVVVWDISTAKARTRFRGHTQVCWKLYCQTLIPLFIQININLTK